MSVGNTKKKKKYVSACIVNCYVTLYKAHTKQMWFATSALQNTARALSCFPIFLESILKDILKKDNFLSSRKLLGRPHCSQWVSQVAENVRYVYICIADCLMI